MSQSTATVTAPLPAPDVPTSSPTPAAKVTWRMRGLALLSALLYPLSHPFVWPGDTSLETVPQSVTQYLAFFCLVPVLVAARKLTPWRAYLFSMWFLVPGTFLLLYWLIIAMNVHGHIPLVFSSMLLLLLSVGGWQYLGTAIVTPMILEKHFRFRSWWTIPVCWTGMEMARAHVYFGGFSWGNLGASQFKNLPVLQLGALGGVYIIIFVMAFSNAVLFEVARWYLRERVFPSKLVAALVGVLVLTYAHGFWRIQHVDELQAAAPKVRVGMLQGNIEQGIKNKDWQHTDFIVSKYEKLQKEALAKGADVIIWPEAAYPQALPRDDGSAAGKRFPSLEHASGVIGATVYWREPPLLSPEECREDPKNPDCRSRAYLHNSAVVMRNDLTILGRFDKTHLVPFGEYVPWPFGKIAKAIVPNIATIKPGASFEPVELPTPASHPRVASLICYEGVFPQYARKFAAAGAELLVNVTNDAWYGISSAAPQHLAFYSVRAAETGRAVARVANTGITAGIDPLGRILSPSRVFEDAVVVVDLPVMREKTLYTHIGDVLGWICLVPYAFALMLGVGTWWRGRKVRTAAA
ncbi:MAG: apolipoprotein N-acyltransferase [Myxococcota bacterium]